jgi:hypothetical protein
MTFTIQNQGLTALGGRGGQLGYGGIGQSVAIKFDLYNNLGEGSDSTGLYTDGAGPFLPSVDLTSTGINLHSGDYIDAHITYDGAVLAMTLKDEVTLATWSHTWPVNIPAIVGGPTAYVGFTGATGGATSSQKLTYWTYLPGPPVLPNYPVGFDAAQLVMNGVAKLSGTALELTDGGQQEASSPLRPTSSSSSRMPWQMALPSPSKTGARMRSAAAEAHSAIPVSLRAPPSSSTSSTEPDRGMTPPAFTSTALHQPCRPSISPPPG